MAVVMALVVALIVAGVAQLVAADLDVARLTQWDTTAQYVAQAGLEHQIYLLKANKDAGAIAYTNYPVTPDQRTWYVTSVTCLLNCAGNVPSRRWRVLSTGEIRQYNPDLTWTVLQTRTLQAEVDITYTGLAPLYANPQRITVLRWEEVLP
jgi:hypothetical protein